MAEAKIIFKLDLILHLVDTTTGLSVSQTQVTFHSDGMPVKFIKKEDGYYILLNYGRKDMQLEITAEGYETTMIDVVYDQLQDNYPEIDIYLIPLPDKYNHINLVTLEGILEDIESIDAIPFNEYVAKVSDYLERKQVLKLFAAKSMEEKKYAIVHEEQMKFEEFSIKTNIDKFTLMLQNPLKVACKPDEKISRIVRGQVDKQGNYLLRVLEDAHGTEYLVRYRVKGTTKYKKIYLSNSEEILLE